MGLSCSLTTFLIQYIRIKTSSLHELRTILGGRSLPRRKRFFNKVVLLKANNTACLIRRITVAWNATQTTDETEIRIYHYQT